MVMVFVVHFVVVNRMIRIQPGVRCLDHIPRSVFVIMPQKYSAGFKRIPGDCFGKDGKIRSLRKHDPFAARTLGGCIFRRPFCHFPFIFPPFRDRFSKHGGPERPIGNFLHKFRDLSLGKISPFPELFPDPFQVRCRKNDLTGVLAVVHNAENAALPIVRFFFIPEKLLCARNERINLDRVFCSCGFSVNSKEIGLLGFSIRNAHTGTKKM